MELLLQMPYPSNNGDLAANSMTSDGGKRYWYLGARDASTSPADPGLYDYPEVRLLALGYRETHTATAPMDFRSPNKLPSKKWVTIATHLNII